MPEGSFRQGLKAPTKATWRLKRLKKPQQFNISGREKNLVMNGNPKKV